MLSKWETLFLIILTLPILGHVVILPLMIDVAGRDAWISIFLSLPFAFIYALSIYFIKVKYKDKNVKEIFTGILGKKLGKTLIFIFICYFLFITIVSFSTFIDFVHILFLPDTPPVVLIIWFLIFLLYGSLKGIKPIALTAGVLAFIAMTTGNTITLLDSQLKEWANLKPIMEFGWSPVLIGTLIIISIWVELIFLLFLPLENSKERGLFLLWSIGILINALMMLSTTTGVITIFGLGQAENMLYPAQEIVRIINLGFLDRFDVYGMILNGFGTYIRCCLYFRLAYELSTTSASKKYKRFVYTLFTIIVLVFVIYLNVNHLRVENTIIVYVYTIVLFPVPLILLLINLKRNASIR
ncbi:GerAB/ArcD/ProY family transporter [Virgibacillus kimchii]